MTQAERKAQQAEQIRRKLALEAAEATLKAEGSSFADRNRARIIIKQLRKGQALK